MVKHLKDKKIRYKSKDLKVHLDERGWLIEILKRNELKEDIKQVYVATIRPGKVRGNHYHLKRTEWFFITGGKADLYLEDLKTGEKICLKISSEKPKLITVFPQVAHAVRNTSKETIYLISVQNTIYNPGDPDTFDYLVYKV